MSAVRENRLLQLLHLKALEGQALQTRQPYATSALKIASSMQFSYPAVEVSVNGRAAINRGLASNGELVSHTFSLTGVMGSLPYAYTELLAQRSREREFAFQAYLNIFNHRAVSLLYESWIAQMWVDTGHVTADSAHSRPRTALFAYTGIDQKIGRGGALPHFWGHVLNHAGVLSRRTRTASGLASLLKNQFQLDVNIEQFVGKWFEISPPFRWRLTRKADTFQLGINTSLGKTTLHPQAFFRVHLMVASTPQYCDLAPGSSQIKLMQQLIRTYVGEELKFQLVIHVAGKLIPLAPLSGKKASGIRIGWNSLLGRTPKQQDYQTSIFRDYSRSCP